MWGRCSQNFKVIARSESSAPETCHWGWWGDYRRAGYSLSSETLQTTIPVRKRGEGKVGRFHHITHALKYAGKSCPLLGCCFQVHFLRIVPGHTVHCL